jgi:hypothetical protein
LDERSYGNEWPEDVPENLSKEEAKEEVIAFKGPEDHAVVHIASVVPDEVMMIDTCVPSRTRS